MSTATLPKKMTAAEVMAEIEWFLDGGVHPLLIAQELGRNPAAIERMSRPDRANNPGVQSIYQGLAAIEARRKIR